MIPTPNENAPRKKGAHFTNLAGDVNGKKKKFFCGVKHTSDIRREPQSCGLGLKDASGGIQRATLLRVLQYLGPRGLNTPEAVGLGYYRIATRIHEMEADGWLIDSLRENIVGADGLYHVGIARYVLKGRRAECANPQGSLDLRGPV